MNYTELLLENERLKNKLIIYDKEISDLTKQIVSVRLHIEALRDSQSTVSWTEDEKRMDVIGQNGNDGDHYE